MEIKKKIAAVLAAATTLMSTFGAVGVSAADETVSEPSAVVNMGDINKDGSVTVADYVMLSNYLTGNGELTAEQAVIADMTRDGVISIFDQILLGRTVCGERDLEAVEEVTEPSEETTEPATEPVTEAETTEPATDPTEPEVTTTEAPVTTEVAETTTIVPATTQIPETTTEIPVTTQIPETTTTEVTTVDPSGVIEAEIKVSNGNYKFSFDEAIGEEVYLVIEADEAVTFANGCVGIEVKLDDVNYWVSYKWEADGSETVKVDLTTPTEITYNSGKDKVTNEIRIAEIVAAVTEKTSGEVQVWWANDAEGEEVDTTLVVLAEAYIIREAEVTAPVTTTVAVETTTTTGTTVAEETTTAKETTVTVETTTTTGTTVAEETTTAKETTVTDETTTVKETTVTVETTVIIIDSVEGYWVNDLSGSIEGVSFTINNEEDCNGAVQVYNSDWDAIGQIAFNNKEGNDVVIDFTTVEELDVSVIKHIQFMVYWPEDTDLEITDLIVTIDGEEVDPNAPLPEGVELPYEETLTEKDFDTLSFSVNPGETEWYGGAVAAYNAAGDELLVKSFSGNGAADFEIDFSEVDTTEITTIQIQYYYGGNSEAAEGVKFTVYNIDYVSSTTDTEAE